MAYHADMKVHQGIAGSPPPQPLLAQVETTGMVYHDNQAMNAASVRRLQGVQMYYSYWYLQ